MKQSLGLALAWGMLSLGLMAMGLIDPVGVQAMEIDSPQMYLKCNGSSVTINYTTGINESSHIFEAIRAFDASGNPIGGAPVDTHTEPHPSLNPNEHKTITLNNIPVGTGDWILISPDYVMNGNLYDGDPVFCQALP